MRILFLFSLLLPALAFGSGATSSGFVCSTNGTFVGKQGGVMGCYTPAGGGDVTGPGTAVVGNIATFDDVGGTTLADSGVAANNLCLLTGNQTVAGIKTFSSAPVMSALTASKPVCTTAGKALSSTCTALMAYGDMSAGSNYRVMATNGSGVMGNAAAITASRALVSDANGIPTHSTVTTTQLQSLVVQSFTGFMAGTSPTDQSYTLDQKAAFAYTINTVDVVTSAGTVSLALQINGTPVTGCSAVSVSSTPATGTCSAANVVAAGDKVTLVLSSNSSAANLAFTVKYTR